MRIIAGAKRGKKLIQKSDEITRPTADRVRESAFNVLCGFIDLNGAKVLDLFAGCGGYGLEAHSRGAGKVVFNDTDKQAVNILGKNCKACGCDGIVLNLDYSQALDKMRGQTFDIIFLDPPYQSDFAYTAIEIIAKQKMLSEKGVIILETENEISIPFVKQKKYGRALLYFLDQHSLPRE